VITQPSESCSRTRVTSNEVVAVGCDKEIRFQRLDTLRGPFGMGRPELLPPRCCGERIPTRVLTYFARRPDCNDFMAVPDEAV
jgi:hypothetical protein